MKASQRRMIAPAATLVGAVLIQLLALSSLTTLYESSFGPARSLAPETNVPYALSWLFMSGLLGLGAALAATYLSLRRITKLALLIPALLVCVPCTIASLAYLYTFGVFKGWF